MDSPADIKAENAPEPSSPPAALAQEDDPPPREASPQPPREKARYKSWRKKYRKMKYHFDDRMEEANELFLANWRAEQVARRIKEQNDQMLEILLDINDSHDMATSKRFDLLASTSHTATQALTPQSPGSIRRPEGGIKLSSLEEAAIHTSREDVSPSLIPADLLDTENAAPGYMTPAHEDEYLGIMDEALEALPLPNLDFPSKPIGNAVLDPNVDIRPRKDEPPAERHFAERCPISVHNWIKQHQPQIHAEREEKTRKDDRGAESDRGGKSPPSSTPAAPGSKRKAKDKNKKEDVPLDALDDELGFDAHDDATFGTSRNKRKKDDDAYRPKGGKSRPSKRKRGPDDMGGTDGGSDVGAKKAKKTYADEGVD